MDLFDYMNEVRKETESPLASRLRPTSLEEVVGQQHIIGKGKLLYRAIKADKLSSIIFYGPSGTGKTTFAKMFASQKGYRAYISSGGKNPLDNYKGEECIILDDLRDSTYKMSDFLKLTDNNTDSLVGCRFYNKSIAECKLLIVTSVKPISEFYFNATHEEREPQQQLFRRFSTYIKMTDYDMTIFEYRNEIKEYLKLAKTKNPVSYSFLSVNGIFCCLVSMHSLSYLTERSAVKYLIPRIERFFATLKMTRCAVCHTERNVVQ